MTDGWRYAFTLRRDNVNDCPFQVALASMIRSRGDSRLIVTESLLDAGSWKDARDIPILASIASSSDSFACTRFLAEMSARSVWPGSHTILDGDRRTQGNGTP